ncbi:MAG: hypothetical protein IPL35_09715 [Sphingobacteriales bacterium]|nr:hypothetical protein [Sphingobacteriales bacterium]
MLISFFKNNDSWIWIALYGLLLFHPFFIVSLPIPDTQQSGSYFYHLVINFIQSFLPWQNQQILIFTALSIGTAIIFNHYVQRLFFVKKTILPGIAFLLVLNLCMPYIYWHPSFLALIFVTLGVRAVFIMYNSKGVSPVFDVGMLLGVASLFFLPSSMLLFLIPISVAVVRIFNFKELLVSLLGIILPFYLSISFFYLTDQLPFFYKWAQEPFLNISVQYTPALFIKGLLFLLVLLLAIPLVLLKYLRYIIQHRKYVTIMFWILVLAFITVGIFIGHWQECTMLFIIPTSFFLAYVLYESPNIWIAEAIHFIFLIAILLFNYGVVQ